MANDLAISQSIFAFENTDQSLHAGQLSGAWLCFLKIPDKANANAVLVVFVVGAFGVSTVNLLAPAKGWLDLTVVHSLSVANDKVIADAIPSTADVRFVNAFNGASR